MALTDEGNSNGMIMPVAPMGGNYGSSCGFGGDWGSWIILFLIFGMFGNGGWGGYGAGGFNNALGYDFPWLINGQNGINANTNAGFNQAATQSQLSGIQSAVTSGFGDTALGIAGINQSVCQTGNGITAAVTGAQNAISQQLANNEIANLNRSFAEQTANTQAVNGIASQLANCCCENRLASANLQNVVQTENCADRAALSDGIRDIISNQTAGTQRILDMLCQDKIDAKNDEISQLRQEILYARGQASQIAQNSTIIDGVYNRLNQCPVGTVPVYGEQPIFTCGGNSGCGCMGGFNGNF